MMMMGQLGKLGGVFKKTMGVVMVVDDWALKMFFWVLYKHVDALDKQSSVENASSHCQLPALEIHNPSVSFMLPSNSDSYINAVTGFEAILQAGEKDGCSPFGLHGKESHEPINSWCR